MNERIKDFYDQVGLDFENFQRVTVTKGDMEKFAELIIWECIGIVEKNESEMHYDNGMYPVYPTVCEIREHFGVEE
jgi:hypothetical protein